MKQKTMEALVKAGKSRDLDIEARESYVGRGMMKQTCGVVVEKISDLIIAAAEASRDLVLGAAAAGYDQTDEEYEDFIEDLLDIRQDSMGRRLIIY